MRKFLILFSFMVVLPAAAQAAPKAGQWLGWYPSHAGWNEYTRYNPHLEHGTHAHPDTGRADSWAPSDWIAQRENGAALLRGFYQADIIRDDGREEGAGAPLIMVGPNFYRLGGKDKNRVIASVSAVKGYAGPQADGVVIVRDWYSKRDIGVFTAQGLILQ